MGCLSPNDPIVINARLPRGESGYWEIIRSVDSMGPWSIADIDGETNQRRTSIGNFIRKLVKGGIARVVRTERTKFGRPKPFYRLVKSPKRAPRLRSDGTPAQPRAQEAMWVAIRSSRAFFTLRELMFNATVDEPPPLSTARWYVHKLLVAGYLSVSAGSSGNRQMSYRLKPGMNSGPKAPIVLDVQAVWDPNLKKVMGEGLAEEAA